MTLIKKFTFPLCLISMYLIAWLTQRQLLLNWDVSWCIQVSERILAGGNYLTDFFDVNLPLTHFLYSPTILLSKHFSLFIPDAFRLYFFILASFSLTLCYFLLKKFFSPEDGFFAKVTTLFLAFIFLVLPQINFGQREVFLLVLTMPYIFLLTNRLKGKSVNSAIAVLIGGLAGIGFAIKPFFCATLGLLELYYLYKKRSVLSWLRPEIIAIMVLFASYILLVDIYYPDYYRVIAPLSLRYFYDSIANNWFSTFLNSGFLFSLSAGLLYFFVSKNQKYISFYTVLLLALIGCQFSYLIQRTFWDYHVLPCFSLSILLYLALFLFNQIHKSTKDYLFLVCLITLIFCYPISFAFHSFTNGMEYKKLMQPFISYLKKQLPNQSVLFVTTAIENDMPTLFYAHEKLAARFAHFELPSIIRRMVVAHYHPASQQLLKDSQFLTQLITDDLNNQKPAYVFVDTSKYKTWLMNNDINYIDYFSRNAAFRQAWQHYHYVASIEQKYSYPDQMQFGLFLADDFQHIKTSHLWPHIIALTGHGTQRIVYYIFYGDILQLRHTYITGHISLTPEEQQFLEQQQAGLLKLTARNKAIIHALMQKAIAAQGISYYKYDIYQRQPRV